MNKKVKDPVCGMDVEPEACKDDLLHANYEGVEYYFCSPFCTAAFINDPVKFIRKSYGKKQDNDNLFKS